MPEPAGAAGVRIVALPDGPLLVEGGCAVTDQAGNAYPPRPGKTGVALCRCGHSALKPWCDASQKRVGFKSGS